MCTACWIENGRAAVVNRATVRAAGAINRLFVCAGGEAGGALHIVLDGWHVSDPCLAYCRDVVEGRKKRHAIRDPALLRAAREVLQYLEDLGIRDRYSALALSENLVEMPASILEPRHKQRRSHRPHPGLRQAASSRTL